MSAVSAALAAAGTILTAIVVFVPARTQPTATISFAPPREGVPLECWTPPVSEPEPMPFVTTAGWPALAGLGADDCDVVVRLALIDGLNALRTPWADALLESARDDDPDPAVRDAARAALGEGR